MLHPRLHMLEKKKQKKIITKTIEKLPSIDRLVLVWSQIQIQFHFENKERENYDEDE